MNVKRLFVLGSQLLLFVLLSNSAAWKSPEDGKKSREIAASDNPFKRGFKGMKAVSLEDLNNDKNSSADWNRIHGLKAQVGDSVTHRFNSLLKKFGAQVRITQIQEDNLGNRHIRMRQYYDQIPVIGSDMIVHVNKDNDIYLVTGNFFPSFTMKPSTMISTEAAIAAAKKSVSADSAKTEGPTSLVVFDSTIAYEITLKSQIPQPEKWVVYIDSRTGSLLGKLDQLIRSAPGTIGSHVPVTGNRVTKEDGSLVTIQGWHDTLGNYFLYHKNAKWGVYNLSTSDWEQRSTSSWGTSDPAAISLGKNFEIIQNFVTTRLGRNSFDNLGGLARANAHEGTNYVNAYWDGSDFHFGDGDNSEAGPLTTLDIAAHEYGHGITQYTSNLTYSYESGALNESFSDIMGTWVEFWAQPDGRSAYPHSTAGYADWLCGEDCWLAGDALRDLRDPLRYSNPSYYLGTYWYTGSGDNGGVHYNSGVQNKAFYLLAEGGSGSNDGHPYNLVGIGIDTAGQIAMYADMYLLTASSQYRDARNAWIQAAVTLGYNSTRVSDAWAAVGIMPLVKHLAASPASLSFDSVGIGVADTMVLSLSNNGGDATLVSSLSFSNPAFSAAVNLPFSVSGGATLPLRVVFRPTSYGPVSGTLTITSNAEDNPVITVPLSGKGVNPAVISITPRSFNDSVSVGDSTYATLNITNNGEAALNWTIAPNDNTNATVAQQPSYDAAHFIPLAKGAVDTRTGLPVTSMHGGPDRTGYTWIDSDEPGGPAYQWSDIKATGTMLSSVSGCDDCFQSQKISFRFPFYGNSFDTIYVSSNGFITFGTGSSLISNYPLPSTSAPANLIDALHDDLDPGSGGDIYFKDYGDRAVIQFDNVYPYSGSGVYTFQIVLERSGAIYLYYNNLTGPLTGATVGIQNASRDDGLTVAYNTTYLKNSLAVKFSPKSKWLSASPLSGTVSAGRSASVRVLFNGAGVSGGTYYGSLDISHNAPGTPSPQSIPCTLLVDGTRRLAVTPSAFNFGAHWVGVRDTAVLTLTNSGDEATVVSSVTSTNPYFTCLTALPLTVSGYGNTTIRIVYQPGALGNHSGTLTVNSNAEDNPAIPVSLSGSGLAAPQINVSPSIFAVTLNPGDSTVQTLRIRNPGGDTLSFSRTGVLPSWISVSPVTGKTAAGDSSALSVIIRSSGKIAGTYFDSIQIGHNAPAQVSPQVVPVRMTVASVRRLTVQPSSLSFGTVWVGRDSLLSITFQNIGNDTTTISNITSNNAVFTQTATLPIKVPPFGTRVIQIRYTPVRAGSDAGTLTVNSDAGDNPSIMVSCTATSTNPPTIAISPSSLLSRLNAGDSSITTLQVSNSGGASLSFKITTDGVGIHLLEGSTILIIGDGGTEIRLDSLFKSAGFSTTIVSDDGVYNGNNPSPSGFAAVVLTDGTNYGSDMPSSGQDSIVRYVQNGGGLITSEWIGYEIENGRYSILKSIIPFTRTSGTSGTETYTVTKQHQISEGVDNSFSVSTATSIGVANAGEIIISGSVAGAALVAAQYGKGKVVSFASAGKYSSYDAFSNQNMKKLMLNSVKWVGGSVLRWLSINNDTATVSPGSSANIQATFRSANLVGGTYAGILNVRHNAPGSSSPVVVPCTLTVDGFRKLAASPSSLNFGSLWTGLRDTMSLTLKNGGNEATQVNSISSSHAAFSVLRSLPFTVAPFDSIVVPVLYQPGSVGSHSGTLTVNSDAEDNPSIAIACTGTGTNPPSIAFSPASFRETLLAGDSVSRDLIIQNSGGAALDFSVANISGVTNNDSLKAYWKMDEGSGTSLYDATAFANTGTITGAIWSTGHLNTGLSFDGVDDNVTIPSSSSLSITRLITLSAWIKPTSTSRAWQRVLCKDNETTSSAYDLGLTSSGGIYFALFSGGSQYYLSGTAAVQAGVWTHIAGTWDGTTMRIYLNGVLQPQTLAFSGPITTTSDPVRIGKSSTSQYAFYGSIDEARIYSRALSSQEITALYNNQTGWVSVSPLQGTVAPAGRDTLQVRFASRDLLGGSYSGAFSIVHNAPSTPSPALVPCTLTVDGFRRISASPSALNFGSIWAGMRDTMSLTLKNSGNEATQVNSISSSHAAFTVLRSLPFTVQPYDSIVVPVVYQPGSVGNHSGTLTVNSNAEDNPSIAVTLTGSAVSGPQISVSPGSLSRSVVIGDSTSATLTLTNSGGAALNWTIAPYDNTIAAITQPTYDASHFIPLVKGAVDTRTGLPVTSMRGGPDRYGYTWIDSDEPGGPAFQWSDIKATGTVLSTISGCDDCYQSQKISFRFPFYGNSFDTIYVSSNGFITFGTGSSLISNYPLPSTSAPANLIDALHDDLDPPHGGYVYFKDYGDRAVIQFDNVPPYSGSGVYTFQIVLERSGAIYLYYNNLTGPLTGATVGIQNAAQNDGLTVVYNAAYLKNSLAVKFNPKGKWLGASPLSGTIAAGQSAPVRVSFSGAVVNGGTYYGKLDISHNAPGSPSPQSVPCTLSVDGIKRLSVTPTALDFGTCWTGSRDTAVLTLTNSGDEATVVSAVTSTNPYFTCITGLPLTVPGFGNATLRIAYQPGTQGQHTGVLTINSNAEDNPGISVTCSGTGRTPPSASLRPDSLYYNLLPSNPPDTQISYIRNTGGDTLHYSIIGINQISSPSLVAKEPAHSLPTVRTDLIYSAENEKNPYVHGRLIVGMSPTFSSPSQSLLEKIGAVKTRELGIARNPQTGLQVNTSRRAYLITLSDTSANGVLKALDVLRYEPSIAYAEPDYIVHALVVPNDPSFSQLYAMQNTGQTGGTVDADIDATDVWERHTGNKTILIGVIDTGIDYLHPDLAANIWTNPGEIPGNGIDDDNNGFIDDVYGWNFANDNNNPRDDHYHGTHCSGTIGGVGNNGIGVAGVMWNTNMIALKFLDNSGSGTTSDAIDAVNYANAMGIKITSNSWGGGAFSQALMDAISLGGLFVAAAGNAGSDNDVTPSYPASYTLDNILAVAATDHNDLLASFSCYGRTSVDLGAPGVNIYSCAPNSGYQSLSGTSMATPHVAGAAGLLWSYNPSLTALQVKQLLMDNVDPVSSMAGKTVTGGRLNINKALQAAGPAWLTASPMTASKIAPGDSAAISVIVNSAGLAAGRWEGDVVVGTDDPSNRQLTIDAVADIAAQRSLAASPNSLLFGSLWVGMRDTLMLRLVNHGNAATQVSSMSSNHAAFTFIGSTSFAVPQFDSVVIPIVYQPASVGSHTGLLTINSNAADNPTITVSINGTAISAPSVSVSPQQVAVRLAVGESTQRTVTVSNSGGADLVWNLNQGSGGMVSRETHDTIPGVQSIAYTATHDLTCDVWTDAGNDAFDGFGTPSVSVGGVSSRVCMLEGDSSYTINGYRVRVRNDFAENHIYRSIIEPQSGEPGRSDITVNLTGNMGSDGSEVNYMDSVQVAGKYLRFYVNEVSFPNSDPRVVFLIVPSKAEQRDSVRYWQPSSGYVSMEARNISLPATVYIIPSYHSLASIKAWFQNDLVQRNNWLSVSPNSGTTQAGQISNLQFSFSAAGMLAGTYYDTLKMVHNAPLQASPLSIPVVLTVGGTSQVIRGAILSIGPSVSPSVSGSQFRIVNLKIGSPVTGKAQGSRYKVVIK
jgi:Zn-dependent metalloprotease/subtilisin family serine protease